MASFDQCEYKAAYKSAVETNFELVHKKELKKRNESVHDGKQHYCNKCEYNSKQKSIVRKHIESVHNGNWYYCDKCEYEAAQKCAVKTHIESVHNGQTLSCL